jgi:hypothetical protein
MALLTLLVTRQWARGLNFAGLIAEPSELLTVEQWERVDIDKSIQPLGTTARSERPVEQSNMFGEAEGRRRLAGSQIERLQPAD